MRAFLLSGAQLPTVLSNSSAVCIPGKSHILKAVEAGPKMQRGTMIACDTACLIALALKYKRLLLRSTLDPVLRLEQKGINPKGVALVLAASAYLLARPGDFPLQAQAQTHQLACHAGLYLLGPLSASASIPVLLHPRKVRSSDSQSWLRPLCYPTLVLPCA